MKKSTRIIRMVIMALCFLLGFGLMIPTITLASNVKEFIMTPIIAVGVGSLLAMFVWLYSFYLKLARPIVRGIMDHLYALSIAGLVIKLMLRLAMYGLPITLMGGVFVWIAGLLGGSNGMLYMGLLFLGSTALLVPVVIADIRFFKRDAYAAC